MHELFQAFSYRPHWGKTLHPDPQYWAKSYPHYQRFQELRRQLDPNGIFTNDYVRSIGLVPQ
jgi:FAD/FMN-containing dehydrogenase